jgi:3,4-dihydroxy 2-butanone 4-phosphate synthase/GTP cyclohydrolase II
MTPQMITVDAIEDVLEDYRNGKMVIMVDDQDRENEGDLLVAAESISDDHINFMASKGRGLICLTLTEERCSQLDLPLMVSRNSARFSTNFTVSIEAAEGVTTGISAQDRAVTVQAAVKPDARPEDLVTPGHIFPIKAQAGGVLTRAGHTEAGVDMARLCGFLPASVICEILKGDGSMARLPDLVEFGEEHKLKIGTIADLISYRLKNDPTLEKVSKQTLHLNQVEFQCSVYHDVVEGGTHMALVKGEITRETVTPVRVHVHRGLLDSVLSPASNWSWTLKNALDAISKQSSGIVVILSYNESVDELVSRINLLNNNQRRRPSTLSSESEVHQNPANLRMLGAGGQILADLGVTRVLALGRQKKAHGLSGFGLEIVDYVESPDQLAQWNKEHDDEVRD